MDIRKMPKVELHLHLDGSVRPKTAEEILGYEVINGMKVSQENVDLNEYLTKFDIPCKIMQTKENIERISYELAEDLKNENVIYAEIRFAPMKHLEQGLTPEEVVDSVLTGFSKSSLKTKIILCMMRGDSFESNEKVIKLAKNYLDKGVGGIDLAGAEGLFPTKYFEDLFKIASNLEVPFTIHAGEADGIESINAALNFGTKRLGHGVRCIEDEDTLARIIKDNILLEVCPTSNINTGIFDKYANHSIEKLFRLGVNVSINTDNRTVSDITLLNEYQKLNDNFKFSLEDYKKMNIDAIKKAFISESEKDELIRIINDYEEK